MSGCRQPATRPFFRFPSSAAGRPFNGRTSSMNGITKYLTLAAIIALAVSGVTAVRADDDVSSGQRNAYVVTNLVSDLAKTAAVQDPVLQNSWGVAFSPAGSPFWIADNATGCSTLYNGDGTKEALQVSIPLPGNVAAPTAIQT